MPSKIIKKMFAAAGTISGTIPAGQGASPDFISYAKFLYPFALSVAAILAVAMIVIAGMEMVTFSWNPVRLQSAKEKIWAALGGLLLAALSFLILRTINPDLITLRLSPPKVTVTSQTAVPGSFTTGEDLKKELQELKDKEAKGERVNQVRKESLQVITQTPNYLGEIARDTSLSPSGAQTKALGVCKEKGGTRVASSKSKSFTYDCFK